MSRSIHETSPGSGASVRHRPTDRPTCSPHLCPLRDTFVDVAEAAAAVKHKPSGMHARQRICVLWARAGGERYGA